MSDGALSIASQAVLGTSATAGDIRTAETYTSDQSSQIELTSTQLSGGQWVGPTVRTQNGGQDTYLGIYFWNSGSPQLRLYKRNAGTWIQLGSSYNSGAAARRHDAAAERRRLDDLVPAGRRHPDHRYRHQHHRRRARDHDLRPGQGRQLGGGGAGGSAPDVLGRRQRLRALGDGRAPGQRRRRPERERQRRLRLRDQARRRRRLRRHRQDEPQRPELQRRERQRHDRGSPTSRSGRQLHLEPDVLGRRQRLRALRDGRAPGQRRRRPDPDSANGSFTFATKLAGGAAYNVTVKTNPSGQSCSVANGSGTIAAADVRTWPSPVALATTGSAPHTGAPTRTASTRTTSRLPTTALAHRR